MDIVILGQAPGPGKRGLPLRGRCGARLAKLFGLATVEELAAVVELRNLLNRYPGAVGVKGDLFPMDRARRAAARLRGELAGKKVVFLGNNVARAFDVQPAPRLTWRRSRGLLFEYAVVPHPSGVNFWWNDVANLARASHFLEGLIKGQGIGDGDGVS